MTTLIIGGTGNTGLALAKLLHAAGRPTLVTSRSGKAPEPFQAVAFNWSDPATFETPFNVDGVSIDRVYIIPPPSTDALVAAKPFIDLAISKNVKKFVLLGTPITIPAEGGVFSGDIYKYLIDTGVDYVVLRPTWFMQNFSYQYLKTIKEDNYFFTTSHSGKTGFTHTDDIAQAAFNAITDDKPARNAPYIFGPDLMSYDEVAQLFSDVLGREITHKKISVEERLGIFASFGIPEAHSKALVDAEAAMSAGVEEKIIHDPKELKHIGKISLKQFIEENAGLWK